MTSARNIIARLNLTPHPEGGWYRETWRAAPDAAGAREGGTMILFLLEQGQRSHWHRVDASEIWLYQAGDPLLLHIADDTRRSIRIGPDIIGGDALQGVVPPQAWQAAEPIGAWTLCACAVVPAFRFEGFELAAPGWNPPGWTPPAA